MKDKIGIVIPTCSPERKPFLDFVLARMQKQTRVPDIVALINYPKTSKHPDLAQRYKDGIQECINNGCTFILFIEDDDYYPLTYVETMYENWIQNNRPNVIGCSRTIYYHIFYKGWQIINTNKHASAHGTGVSSHAVLHHIKMTSPYFDIELWRENSHSAKLVFFNDHCISIKHGIGLCGGGGHDKTQFKHVDENYEELRKFVDAEAFNFYMNIVQQQTQKTVQENEGNPLHPAYYDKAYSINAEYQKTEPEKSIYFPVWQNVLQWLDENSVVLELGCGTGLLASYLMKNKINYQRGIDFSEVAIQKAQQINNNAKKFQVKDIHHIVYIPKHFTVVCLEVMEHLESDLSVFDCMASGTQIIFGVPDFDCGAHQRFFTSAADVMRRYMFVMNFTDMKKIKIADGKHIYLVKGVRV